MLVEFGRRGLGTILREFKCCGDFAIYLGFDLGAAFGLDQFSKLANRIAFFPRRDFFLATVAKMVVDAGTDVLLPAIGHDLEELRALSGANRSDGVSTLHDECQDVVAVDSLGWKPKRARAIANIRNTLSLSLVRVNRVLVVFTHEQDRQLFQSG